MIINGRTSTLVPKPVLLPAAAYVWSFERYGVKYMKLDMHCHTQEGSLDGKIQIAEYIESLKKQGFDGMLVTDHNSYNGYRHYAKRLKDQTSDFVVLKGIEYDTIDAGHIIVIMPENVRLPILEYRGLPLKILQDIVHRFGGILGPAHPCGERHLSYTQTRAYKKRPDLTGHFDFVEAFNSCESDDSNANALRLAKEHNLPTFGGSDSHCAECVGTAYTVLDRDITCESELIGYVREKEVCSFGGRPFCGTVKNKLGVFNHILVESFWFYNRLASLMRHHKRKHELLLMN